jgi:threonine dehydratase
VAEALRRPGRTSRTAAEGSHHPERTLLAPRDYRGAAARIAPYIRRTPVLRAAVDGRAVSFKLEHLQVAGVFKIRGALNALLSACPRHVVTASGGNHGLGVATAARWLGIPATVFVPATVPEAKARRIAAQGADVVKTGSVYADAERAARSLAAERGLCYVHAYDDPAVVAGQGTVGLEIAADIPDWDAVAVPAGGGGLLAGVAGALFSGFSGAPSPGFSGAPPASAPSPGGTGAPRRAPAPERRAAAPERRAAAPERRAAAPERRVVAAEPEGCPTLHAAIAAGEPVEVGADSVAASALGASRAGEAALAACRAYPVTSALVSDEQILSARDRLWEEFRLAVEPAAATVFAAWLSGQVPGENPCLVLSGGNADWTPA